MKKNDKFNFTSFNKFYIKLKEKKLNKLDNVREKIEKELETEKLKKIELNDKFVRINAENGYLNMQYSNYKRTIIDNGITFSFENENFNIKEWDNLQLRKSGNSFAFLSKSAGQIFSIENIHAQIVDEILKEGYSYSLVVIRVTRNLVKCQLRFIKNEKAML